MISASCAGDVEDAIGMFGVAPGGSALILAEAAAANESINSGLYIIWRPNPYCVLPPSASDEIRDGTGQCCRVGSKSVCECGHPLSSHAKPKLSSGFIRPPACSRCRCGGFTYTPTRPEECGQWWLPRRRDFDLIEWQRV